MRAGSVPQQLAVATDGDSLYVTNRGSNDVSQYEIAAGGSLTAKRPRSVAAGTDPAGSR